MDIKDNPFFEVSAKLTDEEIMARIKQPMDYQHEAVSAATEVAKNRNLISQSEYDEFHKKNEVIWFYEKGGKRIGPVSEAAIVDELTKENINDSTLVWKKGFDDWTELKKTELQRLLSFNKNENEPPPLKGSKINNTAIWLLAFAPIIGFIIETILVYETADSSNSIDPNRFWWITLLANISLGLWDDRKLKNAGLKTVSSFWTLLVPVYLWKRSNATKQTKAYFWVWVATFILIIILGVARDEDFAANNDAAFVQQKTTELQQKTETTINETKPQGTDFNKSDASTLTNGNAEIGILKIRDFSENSIWELSEDVSISTLSKNPYGLLGRLIKVKGKVSKISELPSDPSEQWHEVLLLNDNPNSVCGYATIGVLFKGSVDKLYSDQTITCAGYYVGKDGCSDGICECFVIVSNIYK